MTFFKAFLVFTAILSLTTSRLLGQRFQQAAKIDAFLQTMMEKSSIPGFAIAVVNKDSVLFMKGYGVSANGQPVTERSLFAIASLSKAFTAMSVMQLVASHKIDLAASVHNYIPGFELDDPRSVEMTVDDLLHQSSGLNDKVFPEMAFNQQPSSLDAAISRMKHVRLGHDPGKQYEYHNPNYQILAKVVENAAHQPFPAYLEQHIFRPLGMISTRDFALTKSFYSPLSHIQNGHIFALGIPIHIKEPDWFVEGAAGIVSNVADLSNWLRLQMNNGHWNGTALLDSVHLKAMHTASKTSPYGMGWFVNQDKTISHSGILWTYTSEQMITGNGYGIVILFNSGFTPFEDYHAFIEGVAQILDNKTPDTPGLSSRSYSLLINLTLVFFIALAIRRLLRLAKWHQNAIRRPIWQIILFSFVRILPILFFLCIPVLVTAVSGRVLNWKRIFLTAPDIIAGMAIIALLHTMIVAVRVYYLIKLSKV